MMAHWDLEALRRDLKRLETPLVLVAGNEDKAVPPRHVEVIKAMLPKTQTKRLPGLGHLAHEENPERVAHYIFWLEDREGDARAS